MTKLTMENKTKIVILDPPTKTEVFYPRSLTEEIRRDYQSLKIPIE